MIAEEETNKETITVLITDQIIDRTMVLNKETIRETINVQIIETIVQITDRITGPTIDRIMDQATDRDPITDLGLIMDQDRIMDRDPTTDPLTDLATDPLIHPLIN
jgi:hypothetical protein